MQQDSQRKLINRFIELEHVYDMLQNKRLIFPTHHSWDDKNDVELINEYQKRKGIKKIFLYCCLNESETIHHWEYFFKREGKKDAVGCCVEFKREELISCLKKEVKRKGGKFRHAKVKYKKIGEIDSSKIQIGDMPFIKRWPYRYEKEYRLIWEGEDSEDIIKIKSAELLQWRFDLSIIKRITVSGKISEEEFKSIKEKILGFSGGGCIEVNHSKVYEYPRWINKFKKAPCS